MRSNTLRAAHIAPALGLCACGWIAGLDEFVVAGGAQPEAGIGSGGDAGAGGAGGAAGGAGGAVGDGAGGAAGAGGAGGAGGCPDCTPVILAAGQSMPYAIAIDETHVYWTNYGDSVDVEGSIARVPKAGGEPTTLVSGPLAQPNSIAVDGSDVYWSNYGNGTIARVPTAGGSPIILAVGQSFASNVRVLGDDVFWLKYVGSHLIVRASAWDGGNVATVVSANEPITGFAIDISSVTWLNWNQKEVLKSPLVGGTPVVIASNQGSPRTVVVGTDNAYWITEGPYYTGSIMKGSLNGGAPPITLVAQLPESDQPRRSIALDDDFAYWTDRGKHFQSNGRVARVPIGGGDVEVLASTQASPVGIAVDDSAVYWTNVDDGTVRKLMKP